MQSLSTQLVLSNWKEHYDLFQRALAANMNRKILAEAVSLHTNLQLSHLPPFTSPQAKLVCNRHKQLCHLEKKKKKKNRDTSANWDSNAERQNAVLSFAVFGPGVKVFSFPLRTTALFSLMNQWTVAAATITAGFNVTCVNVNDHRSICGHGCWRQREVYNWSTTTTVSKSRTNSNHNLFNRDGRLWPKITLCYCQATLWYKICFPIFWNFLRMTL